MKKLEDMTNDELVDLFNGTLEDYLAKVDFNIDLIPSNEELNKTMYGELVSRSSGSANEAEPYLRKDNLRKHYLLMEAKKRNDKSTFIQR